MNLHSSPTSLRTLCLAVTSIGLMAASSTSQGAPISNWTQFSGSVSSGLNTSSPVLGNGSTESADGQSIYAVLGSTYQLSNVGDLLTFSGSVTLTGSGVPESDQFRFGLYDSNGQSGATGWLGYFATNSGTPTGGTGPTQSRLWERNDPNAGSFGSGTGATQRATVTATPNNTSFVNGGASYTFSLSMELLADDALRVSWSILGTTYAVNGTYLDATPETFSFNRVGIFTGGTLNANQASFSNMDITYTAVPEPQTAVLLAGGLLMGMITRRRRSQAAR